MLTAFENINVIDRYNTIDIETITTTDIKLVMTVHEEGQANGIYRWKVRKQEEDLEEDEARELALEAILAKIAEVEEKLAGLDEEEYTVDSWNAVEEALEAAKAVTEETGASSIKISNANTVLIKAFENLKTKADVEIIENVVWSDDMETLSAADAGWTVEWSGTEGTGTEGRTANEWAANNTTTWWNFKTETEAQTLTLTKVVEDLPAGAYKASIDADGGNATGTIAVKAGDASQAADITLGGWDAFVTTTTDVLTTTETADITIEITMDSLIEGWFDFDNIKLISEVEDTHGTLVNGDLSTNTKGWTITGDIPEVTDPEEANGYMIGSDDAGNYLSIWTEEGFAGTYSMSQTIENVAAGEYTASVAAVGNGGKGASESKNSLTLTVKNETQNTEVSVQIVPDGWDNWNAISKTEALAVAEGDTVTITISGTLDGKEWYGLKNVVFDTDTTIEAPISVEKVPGLSEDFIHGIDVSTYLSLIQSGAKYYDENGEEKNMFEIFSDAGVNYVRLRVWNCPFGVDANGDYLYVDDAGKEYTADQVTTTQHELGYYVYTLADGTEVYRKGYGAGNADIDMAVATGKIATQYGMKVLIDFHYSDFWADPAKYRVPKAWEGMDIDTKANALAEYTTECLQKLKDAGVDVGMVQVGNEINNGLSGESNWTNVAKLLKAGTEAVRNFDENILIAIHYANPESGEHANRAARLEEAGIDYDVFASSYYSFWHGTTANLTKVLKEIADTYNKKVMVAEVSYCYTLEDGDGGGSVVNKNTSPLNYSIDAEGQAAAVRDAIAAVAAVGEAGIGTFYWEPAWIPVKNYADASEEDKAEILEYNSKMWQRYGSGWASLWSGDAGDDYDPGVSADPYTHGSEWDNQAMFDFNGKALPSINVYKWVYTGAEGPVKVSTVDTLSYEMEYKTTPELPSTVNVYLNDGNIVENVTVTWDAEQVAALETADFGDYTIDGTLNEFSYESKGETITVAAGTVATSCKVKVYGKNYLVNGDFEDNDGDGYGWTLTGSANLANKASDAKSGNYHWSAWNASKVDFTVSQTVETELPNGKYTLYAYYQGTNVDTVNEGSGLYVRVTYADGTVDEKVGAIEIPNIWQVFHKANVTDIIITDDVTSVEVWSRLSATGEGGPWVVLDDVNLVRADDVTEADRKALAVELITAKITEVEEQLAGLTKADYTEDSWFALQDALTTAETILTKEDATAKEITAAQIALEEAYASLKTVAQAAKEEALAELTAKMAEIQTTMDSLNATDYTTESWNALLEAMEAAEAMLTNEEAVAAEVRAARVDIEYALEDLAFTEEKIAKDALAVELEEIEAEIAKLEEADYTEDSWSALQEAIAAAEAILENAEATAEEIQTAQIAVEEAYADLKTKEQAAKEEEERIEAAAKEEATEKLTEKADEIEAAVEDLDEDMYTVSSWNALQAAIGAADAILDNPEATSEEIKAVQSALEEAYASLKTKAEAEEERAKAEAVEDLTEEIAKAKDSIAELNEADYTEESWSALQSALAEAEAILTDATAKSEDVITANEKLAEALKKLKTKADAEEEAAKAEAVVTITAEITKAKDTIAALDKNLYTEDSWEAVVDAIAEAEKLLADEEATTVEINDAKAVLTKALDGLQTLEEETEEQLREEALKLLQESINAAKEMIAGELAKDYTTSSWNALQNAIAAAEAMLLNTTATSAQVEAVRVVLDTAMDELEFYEAPVTAIKFAEKSFKIAAGKKLTLNPTVLPEDAYDPELEWTSSKSAYASVNDEGVVVTKKAGAGKTVTITAKAVDGSGVRASVKIKIMKHAVKKISLKAAKTVKAGKKVKVKATITTTGSNTNKKLIWKSSNEAWATVKNGVVKTTKAGKGKKVTITAVSTDGTNKKAKVRIKIK